MKTVIIPVVLLVSVLLFVVFTGVSVNRSLNGLIEQTKALPDSPQEDTEQELRRIEEHWNKHKELYSAIIKFDFVYNFSKEINAAIAGCAAEDPGTYLSAKRSMINILEYIKDVQKLKLDNII